MRILKDYDEYIKIAKEKGSRGIDPLEDTESSLVYRSLRNVERRSRGIDPLEDTER